MSNKTTNLRVKEAPERKVYYIDVGVSSPAKARKNSADLKHATISKRTARLATRRTETEITSSDTARLRQNIYEFILRTGNAGVTDEEIALAFGIAGDSARPRRNELVKANLIGTSGQRRHTNRGRTATVWKSTLVLNKAAARTR